MTPDLGAPQRGRIHLAGRDLLALPPHQRARAGIGYVPQGREVIPQLTVRDNLHLALEARHDRPDPQVFDLFPALETMLERRGGARPPGQTRPHRGPVPGGDQRLFECVKSRFLTPPHMIASLSGG